MRCEQTPLNGLLKLIPTAHSDERGFFLESYREDIFRKLGIDTHFIQDNHARSEQAGIVRGLHFQAQPHAQAKLVWVTCGSVFDVVVDIRATSPTYGKYFACELSAANFVRLYIPHGFAHGYITLAEHTDFQYKVDNLYCKEAEGGIFWNDPELGIPWPEAQALLSEKDAALPLFGKFTTPFK
jgi:dTDP-4-dehydrorhamnose 3,5-epimerase